MGAAKAVHTYLEEETGGLNVKVENVTDKSVFGYCHYFVPLNNYSVILVYYNTRQ